MKKFMVGFAIVTAVLLLGVYQLLTRFNVIAPTRVTDVTIQLDVSEEEPSKVETTSSTVAKVDVISGATEDVDATSGASEDVDAASGASKKSQEISDRNRAYGQQLSDPNLSKKEREVIIQEKKAYNRGQR